MVKGDMWQGACVARGCAWHEGVHGGGGGMYAGETVTEAGGMLPTGSLFISLQVER